VDQNSDVTSAFFLALVRPGLPHQKGETICTISETLYWQVAITTVACTAPKAIDVSENVKNALKQQGFTDVSVSDDTQATVVTLTGHVPGDHQKAAAESLAKSLAGNQVVSNQVAVLPPGEESTAKTVNSDLDKGIEKNLEASLLQNGVN
jgi:hypothetical protein